MRLKHRHAILAGLVWLVSANQALPQPLTFQHELSIPEWARTTMARSGLDKTLVFDARLNPFYHRGDFDGDGTTDLVVLVKQRATGKSGVAFLHRGTDKVFVVGAGTKVSNGGDDFSGVDAWVVFDKGQVPQGATTERPPTLKGDALLVIKSEASSGLLWWNGTGYRWYQQGD